MENQIQELRYQVGEAWKGAYNAATVYGNAAVVQDTAGLSVYRSLKSGNVGHPLTDAEWWFCIIDMSSIKALADSLQAIDGEITVHEAERVAAEAERVAAEASRVSAELARVAAEQQRASAESGRAEAEQTRVNQENARVASEVARVAAEQARVAAEQARVSAENARVAAETQRQLNEENRVAAETERIEQAAEDHTQAVSDHTQAASDHAAIEEALAAASAALASMETALATASADHTQAVSDHQQAASDHTTAASDHTTAAADHTQAAADHTASEAATQAAQQAAEAAGALQEALEDGSVVPAAAENLKSWTDSDEPVENDFDETIRTTAGEDPINTADGGTILSIRPISDFKCAALLATAENQLRLKSNGGGAVAVGAGWYFPVPKLTLGAFGTAEENNGLILVAANGTNITNATVYFKPLASGVPTSVTDGTVATSQDVTYKGKTYKVYTTSGPGYIIVSGITYANTCARIAWEDWYDKFVSPTAEDDLGGSVNLAPLFVAAPNGTGKFLVCGNAATTAKRISATQWQITDPIARIESPVWTDTPDEVEEGATQTYTHSLVIADIATNGMAMIEGSQQALSVNETTVSYSDTNETAISGAVRYCNEVPATATVNLASEYTLNDVGVEMKENAEGEATFVCGYSQNIADSLSIAAPRLNDLRKSAAAVSLGYAVCTTGTYDAAKTVDIPYFMLLESGVINVLFTTPINTERSTLNVSSTGAKPIKVFGSNLPAGVVKSQTYATLAYDGEAWNIVSMFVRDAAFTPADLIVDMGLPSGVKWASRDIDITKPGGFCETPFVYEKTFFSWGNIDGHNPTSNGSFSPWNWGSVNAQEPWYEGQPYGTTKGNTLTGNIPVGEEFDAARANLGAPWRMPTNTEYGELFANIRYINADGSEVPASQTDKRVTVNGVVGLYLESTINGARLFFSASGYGAGTSRHGRGSGGDYWSAAWGSARSARGLYFSSGGVYPQGSDNRYYGFAVRAVQ